MSITHGAEANLSRDFLESAVEREFTSRGVPVFGHAEKGENGDLLLTQFLLRHVPYRNIYGCMSRSEFVYRQWRCDRNIRIECRWQQVGGSVDEKLPYMLLNARDAMPEREIWFVLDGGGARQQAVNWLRQQSAQITSKNIRVVTMPEARDLIKAVAREGAA